jgi:ABC-2 type transport system permease protein
VSASAPLQLLRTARAPGLVVAGVIGRGAARSGALWGVVFGLFMLVQTRTYTSQYSTPAARLELMRAYETNLGVNALVGPIRDIDTVSGWATWRFIGVLAVLGSLWGLLTATRLLRGEEEAGRYELLVVGRTTRARAAGQAVTGLAAGLLVLFVLCAAALVVLGRSRDVGFSVGQCLAFAGVLVAGPAMFAAIGALTSQLVDTRRRAVALAGAVLGVSYAVRMVADSRPGLQSLAWLSPLGWLELVRPVTRPRPLALVPIVITLIVCVAAAVRLAAARDVGAGALPATASSAPRLASMRGPVSLAARLMRPVALGWLLGVGAMSVLIGATAEASTSDSTESSAVAAAVRRLGGAGNPVELYLGLTFVVLALLVAMIAAGQVAALAADETDGHLENLLVRPLHRVSWLAGRLGLVVTLLAVASLAAGFGAWAGTASQHSQVGLGSLLLAGANLIPSALFVLGVGVLAFGVRPRQAAAVVYGYLAWSALIQLTGGFVGINRWLMDTSIFFHMVPAPATSPDWPRAATVTALAALLAVLGGAAFSQRDLQS